MKKCPDCIDGKIANVPGMGAEGYERCETCNKAYDDNVEHFGKDAAPAEGGITKHAFASSPMRVCPCRAASIDAAIVPTGYDANLPIPCNACEDTWPYHSPECTTPSCRVYEGRT